METVIAFLLGLLAGLVVFALFLPTLNKRVRTGHQAELDQYEAALAELRQERADDRETNRRLRRELAINTPESLRITKEERDRAIDELDKLNAELRQATSELADRDRSLREARLAIHDIRVQLERDRFAMTGRDTEANDPGFDAEPDLDAGPRLDPDLDPDLDPGAEFDPGADDSDELGGTTVGYRTSLMVEADGSDGDHLVDEDELIGDRDRSGEADLEREFSELEPARYDYEQSSGAEPTPDGRRQGASLFFGDYPVGGATPS